MTEIVDSAHLPPAVEAAILDLLAVFGGQNQSPGTLEALARAYAKAIDGFPLDDVLMLLDALVLRNPRNPWPPTAQDVFEGLCRMSGQTPSKPVSLEEFLKTPLAQLAGRQHAIAAWEKTLSPEAMQRKMACEASERATGTRNLFLSDASTSD